MIIPSFSSRLPATLASNRLSEAVAKRRASGAPVIDLTVSNPTAAGFTYDEAVLTALADVRNLIYDPSAAGALHAREAVAAEIARSGRPSIAPSAVILTASTSEAYAWLFKLLCDAGDDVLVPQPSYPLFDWLTRLEAVHAKPYRLEYQRRWSVDVSSISAAVTPRTRAILIVSPNNPTGSYVTRAELDAIATAAPGVPIVGDEVFWDYALPAAPSERASVLESRAPLTFSLGGLSKSAALPQMKLGWISMGGEVSAIEHAREKLELVADTYLSVSTPVQTAARVLIESGMRVREQISRRTERNLAALEAAVAANPAFDLLRPEGGWYAIVRVPATRGEEDLVIALAEEDGVLVHPGYFFDFEREAYLVLSLIAEPGDFDQGLSRIIRRFQ